MDMTDLDTLRAEHADSVIGPQLAQLLARIVRATAPAYPAREYSESGAWDDASLQDVLHDWIETRLLRRGDLALLLASARTAAGLRSLLTRSFTQHLVNHRKRSTATNLFARAAKMLRTDDDFQMIREGATSGETAYHLAASQAVAPASAESVRALTKVASALSDDELQVVRYGPYALKSSPILREPLLKDFITLLLSRADGYMTVAQLVAVMIHRFNLTEPDPTLLDERTVDVRADVAATAETHLLARTVLATLGHDRARMLRALADADGDPAAAAKIAGGASSAELTEVADAVHALIADFADDPDEAVAVFRSLVESLYLSDDRP